MNDFEQLYSKYFSDVYKFILSMCKNQEIADDIVQETFFKVLKNNNKIDNVNNIKTWLCQIAKNTYFNYIAKNNKVIPINELELESDKNIEKDFLDKETSKSIHKILHKLDEPYKEVFYLRIFGSLTFKEIAEIFEKDENWARVTFHRSKLKIKEEIK